MVVPGTGQQFVSLTPSQKCQMDQQVQRRREGVEMPDVSARSESPLDLTSLLFCFLLSKEPALGQQSRNGNRKHVGKKHLPAEVWLPFHSARSPAPRLQCYDE